MAGRDEKNRRENALQRFFRETSGELRRVSWPTWQEARNLTVIVIIVLIIMALFLYAIDNAATFLLSKALGV